MRRVDFIALGLAGAGLFLAGCAGGGAGAEQPAGRSLPDLIGGRFAPPVFATRPVDGERAAVLDAALAAANGMGYAVNRFDGASGRISASRRQVSSFDGARQNTLEITVSEIAPGAAQVRVELREAEETSGWGEASGAPAASALVRDRAPYDIFFERLEAALRGGVGSADGAR